MIVCGTCQTEVLDGSAFCDYCGTRLTASKPSIAPTQVAAPQEQATWQPDIPVQAYRNGAAPAQAAQAATPGSQSLLNVVIMNSGRELKIPISDGKIIMVGRRDTVQRIIPDIDLTHDGGVESGVSRKHARIVCGMQANTPLLQLEDLGSANGTYINRQQVMPNRPGILHSNDEVRFGRVVVRFTW